jgi:hypothetical protein
MIAILKDYNLSKIHKSSEKTFELEGMTTN